MFLRALLAAGALVATTPTVPADTVAGDVGDATLVGRDGSVVNEGDGSTTFFIVLPDGATCPGDSAHDQWRVNTFLVPAAENVLDIWFGSTGPEPPWQGSRYPMFDNGNGLALSQIMVLRNESAGQPGRVDQVHETSFLVHAQNDIPSGLYRIGIACSFFRQTTQYWDLAVEITNDGTKDPADLHWRIVESATSTVPHEPFDTEGWLGRGLVALGALLVLALVITRRRPSAAAEPAEAEPTTSTYLRPRTRTDSKEHLS